MNILVTGGAGYIGSHTCVELLENDYNVVVVDNLSNSNIESLKRVEEITEKELTFYEADITNEEALEKIFKREKIEAVIHFAGLKAVGESVKKPHWYYQNNINGTLVLLSLMKKYDVKNMVFSSSATVYGDPASVPIMEKFPLSAINPYGWTKLIIEQILRDISVSEKGAHYILLRYFNPVGAHRSGRIGEDPNGIPNNLMPYISQVAVGKLKKISVFGKDYPTADGTGVRDYIHVVDLAKGHVKALEYLPKKKGSSVFNLGTGRGYSVLEMIAAFEKVCGQPLPYDISPRRSGDIAECYADVTLAREKLNWKAKKNLEDMCKDSWRWQSENPEGYGKKEVKE